MFALFIALSRPLLAYIHNVPLSEGLERYQWSKLEIRFLKFSDVIETKQKKGKSKTLKLMWWSLQALYYNSNIQIAKMQKTHLLFVDCVIIALCKLLS